MRQEFSEHNLATCYRIAQKQQKCSTLQFSNDRIVRKQQGNEGNKKDRETGKTDDDDIQTARADIAGRRTAQKRKRQSQRRK